MPDDARESTGDDQGTELVPGKRLVTLISTKGKTPEEAAAEVMANWAKYKKAKQDSELPGHLHG